MSAFLSKQNSIYEIGFSAILQIALLSILLSYIFNFGSVILLLPALLAIILMVCAKHFEWAVLLLLASSCLFIENPEGISTIEIIYFSLVILVFTVYPGSDILKGNLKLNTSLDYLALTITLLLVYSMILGFVNGGNPALIVGETTYYFGFLGFFAYRKYLHKSWFQKALLSVFILILLYVAIRNVYYYREILIAAYAEWQAQKARAATNELLLLVGALGSVSFVLYSAKWHLKILGVALLCLFAGDLIITQSRGYWLAFAFGLFSMWIVADRKSKFQILGYGTVITSLGILGGLLFFNDIFHLVLDGLSNRIESLFTLGSGSLDVSLKERLLESKTVFNKIIKNPVAGYGFGITFPRYFYLPQTYVDYSYVHNGYLAAWYKLGFLGLFTLLWYCWTILKTSYSIYKQNLSPATNIIFLTIFSSLMSMLLVNNTSPQFLSFDSMLVLGLMGATCAIYHEKYISPQLKK